MAAKLHPLTIIQNSITSFKSRITLVPARANTIGPGIFMKADYTIGGVDGFLPVRNMIYQGHDAVGHAEVRAEHVDPLFGDAAAAREALLHQASGRATGARGQLTGGGAVKDLFIYNGRILAETHTLPSGYLLVRDGKIASMGDGLEERRSR